MSNPENPGGGEPNPGAPSPELTPSDRRRQEAEERLRKYQEEIAELKRTAPTSERAKFDQNLRNFFNHAAVKAIAIVGAVGMVGGLGFAIGKKAPRDNQGEKPKESTEQTDPGNGYSEDNGGRDMVGDQQIVFPDDVPDALAEDSNAQVTPDELNQLEGEKETIELTGVEVLDETIDGSFTQYDNVGCFKNKSPENSPIDVGSPEEVLKAMGVDPETATPEQWGQAMEYMSFSQNISAGPIAYIFNFPVAQGKTYKEFEDSIKDLSDDEKESLTKDIKAVNDDTKYTIETGNGVVTNQYAEKDENGEVHSTFNEKDVTGKKLLAAKTTLAEPGKALDGSVLPAGTDVLRYYDLDCGNLNMIIYLIPNEAPIVYLFSNPQQPIDTPSIIPTNPENPTPTPTPTPDDSKNSDAIYQNMQTGDETSNYVTPSGPGSQTSRPDTTHNSYEEEHKPSSPESTGTGSSASETGQSVQDIINNANQDYSGHQTYTKDQDKQNQAAAEAAKAQAAADAAAAAAEREAEANAKMTDDAAADWFNNSINPQG